MFGDAAQSDAAGWPHRCRRTTAPTTGQGLRPLASSTVAFALALLVMITLHELAHAVAALSLGLSPVMGPFTVETGGQTAAQNITTAAAGPLFSLVSGLVVLTLPRAGTPFARLAVLWFGLLSRSSTATS